MNYFSNPHTLNRLELLQELAHKEYLLILYSIWES